MTTAIVNETEKSASALIDLIAANDTVDVSITEKLTGTETECINVISSVKVVGLGTQNIEISGDVNTDTLNLIKACTTGNVTQV